MTTTTHEFSWLGSGWLASRPPEIAWLLLTTGLALGIVIILVSYRFTLVSLPRRRRAILSVLRFAMSLALLAILAGPTQIERTYDRPASSRPLALVIDRSDSMTTADNRKQRRIDDALLKWHRLEAAARQTFPSRTVFAFAQGMTPVDSPADAGNLPGGRTDLFAAEQAALTRAPAAGWGAIVTLTDGLDTSGADVSEAQRKTVRAALAASTPLFFVVGHNRAIEPPFFRIRELNLPARTAPHSVVRVEAIFDSYQTAASTIPVRLTVAGNARFAAPLQMEAGRHLETWSAELLMESAGTVEVELTAGTEMARAEVRVEPPMSCRILYEAGAPDWGYHFLADILTRGDGFRMTPVFDQPTTALVPGSIPRMPDSLAGLQPYDVVVLAGERADRIPSAQQQVLTRWISAGGILVFLASDDESAQGFAGSELEKTLPIVLMPADSATTRISIGGYGDKSGAASPVKLTRFAWENTPLVREIFAQTPDAGLTAETPLFASFVRIDRSKPGAEVLARHPTETGPDGNRAILLAVQRYGRGRSVMFATDALWRWKLNQPSASRGAELFWQHLFSWLSRDSNVGLAFDRPPLRATSGRDVTLRLAGAGTQPVRVEASLGADRVELTEQPAADDSREFRWRPMTGGFWQIEAHSEDGHSARTWLLVDPPSKPGELSGAAPDEDLLRTLAAQTGGAVVEDIPAAWSQHPPPPQLVSERRQPLWDRAWIFAMLLGLYGVELILRRRWKLL